MKTTMKIEAKRESLVKVLDVIFPAVDQKGVLPIWSNLLFIVKDGKFNIYGRGEAMQIRGFLTVKCKENHKFCVPAKLFYDTMKLLTSEEVKITNSYEDTDNGPKNFKTVITTPGSKKRYTMSGVNPIEYGTVQIDKEKATIAEVRGEALVSAMTQVWNVVDTKDLRESLGGVSIRNNSNGNIEISAATPHYMGRMIMDSKTEVTDMLIPREAAGALQNFSMAPEIKIGTDGNYFILQSGSFVLCAVLVNGTFPNITQFWEEGKYNDKEYIIVNKSELISSFRRLEMYSNKDKDSTVYIDIDGDSMVLSSKNVDFNNDAEETIDIKNKIGKHVYTAINSGMALNVLGKLDSDEVRIFVLKKNSPIFFNEVSGTMDPEKFWLAAPVAIKD